MLLKIDVKFAAIAAAVLTFAAGTFDCNSAAAQMVPSPAARQATKTEFASRMFTSAMGRIARGEPAGAVRLLNVLVEIAPELPELHYSQALAMTLADFDRREQALPAIEQALAREPGNPLYALLRTIVDPRQSEVRGADLYVSADLRAVSQGLADQGNARNAKFLGRVFAAIEPSGDHRLPYRVPGFAGLVGNGGFVKIAAGAEPVALGQLLALTVPSDRFAPYEAQLVAMVEARGQGNHQSPQAVQLAQNVRR